MGKIELTTLTDLQFLNLWVEQDNGFICPRIYRELNRRGLGVYVDKLQGDLEQRKAGLYARLANAGLVYGDSEIDQIASVIKRVEKIQREIYHQKPTEVATLLELTSRMQSHLEFINNYFKKPAVLV